METSGQCVNPDIVNRHLLLEVVHMASTKQRNAARKNIKKAAAAARKKRTIAHLPKSVRTALGKQGAKVARRTRKIST
jgi:hypothetical protein